MKYDTFEALEKAAAIRELTPKERYDYERSLKVLRDNYVIALHERQQGHAEGLAEGRNEGFVEVARRMKAKGKPVEEMEDITGLDIETIKSL